MRRGLLYPRPRERYERFRLNAYSPLYDRLMHFCTPLGISNRPWDIRHEVALTLIDGVPAVRFDTTLSRHVFETTSAICAYDPRQLIYPAYVPISLACWWSASTVSHMFLPVLFQASSESDKETRGASMDVFASSDLLRAYINGVFGPVAYGVEANQWYCTGESRVQETYTLLVHCVLGTAPAFSSSSSSAVGNQFTGARFQAWRRSTAGLQYSFVGLSCDMAVWFRELTVTEWYAFADPSNVDLRVPNGPPLILPVRTFWPSVVATPTYLKRRSLGLRAGTREAVV